MDIFQNIDIIYMIIFNNVNKSKTLSDFNTIIDDKNHFSEIENDNNISEFIKCNNNILDIKIKRANYDKSKKIYLDIITEIEKMCIKTNTLENKYTFSMAISEKSMYLQSIFLNNLTFDKANKEFYISNKNLIEYCKDNVDKKTKFVYHNLNYKILSIYNNSKIHYKEFLNDLLKTNDVEITKIQIYKYELQKDKLFAYDEFAFDEAKKLKKKLQENISLRLKRTVTKLIEKSELHFNGISVEDYFIKYENDFIRNIKLEKMYIESIEEYSENKETENKETTEIKNNITAKNYALCYLIDLDMKGDKLPMNDGGLAQGQINAIGKSKYGKTSFSKAVRLVLGIDRYDKVKLSNLSKRYKKILLTYCEDKENIEQYLISKNLID